MGMVQPRVLSFQLPTKSLLTDKAAAISCVFGAPFHPNWRIDLAFLQHPQLQLQTPTLTQEFKKHLDDALPHLV